MISSTFLYKKKKAGFAAKLSLVSLMDIFTILVFFLLLNSGETEDVTYTRYVSLPNSITGTNPHDQLVVIIGKEEILLEDQVITTVEEALKKPGEVIAPLAEALEEVTTAKGEFITPFEKQNGFSVTIMGDQSVRYALLKSVMTTCRQQDYRNISLAVNQGAVTNYPSQSPENEGVSPEGSETQTESVGS